MGPEICICYKFAVVAKLYTFEQITPCLESQISWLKQKWELSTYTINIHLLSLYQLMPLKQVQDSFLQFCNPNILENRTFAFSPKFDSNSFGNKPHLLTVFIYYILFLLHIYVIYKFIYI